MGGGQISLKNLRASLFNDDQSKEPDYLAGEYSTFKVTHTQKLCKKHTIEVSTIYKHLVHNFHLIWIVVPWAPPPPPPPPKAVHNVQEKECLILALRSISWGFELQA